MAKALVAFRLNGDSAAAAIDQFYTAVLSSPLSMEGLSQSLKNSASSFATLIEFTNKSGSDLKAYKEDLLQLNVAMSANMTRLGLSASQGGKPITCHLTPLTAGKACYVLSTKLRQRCA